MTEVAQLKSDNESSHLLPSNPATPLPKAFPVCCLPAHARAARPSSVAAVDTRARQTTPKNKKKTKAGRRECASPSLFTSRGVQGAGHTLSTSRLGLCSSSPPPPLPSLNQRGRHGFLLGSNSLTFASCWFRSCVSFLFSFSRSTRLLGENQNDFAAAKAAAREQSRAQPCG